MSSIDTAIARIQDIALALNTITDVNGNSVVILSAPDYPIEAAPPFPACSSYLGGGEFNMVNATVHKNFPNIVTEFHLSRVNVKQAYKQINAIAIEFPQRLAGDPTLNGTVETIVSGLDNRVTYTVRPFIWREQTNTQSQIMSQMIAFTIPVKLLKSPIATS
jgi:hypothetical protein